MAADKVAHTATEMDYPAHERNYSGFIKLFKYGTILTLVVTAIVVYILAN